MKYILLTTTSCPKCPAMKEFVQNNFAEESGEILDETSPNFMDLVQKYGVTVAPVLIILEGEKEVFRGTEPSEIEYFLEKL